MPSISEPDDAIFPDLPPPPPIFVSDDASNYTGFQRINIAMPEEVTATAPKPRAKRTNWVAIGMDHLKNNSIYALIKASPSHPITAEFVRRHMQVNHQTYENPNPTPKTSNAWFSHIGRFVGDTIAPINGDEICHILQELCLKFSFDELPIAAGKHFVNRFNLFFSGLVSSSDIHFSIARISLPNEARIKPNDHFGFNAVTKRIASFPAWVNIGTLSARPSVTLSSCLSGLASSDVVKHNAEFIKRKLSNFLYITSFVCHHAYACINGIDDFAELQKQINIYRDNHTYTPYSLAIAALNFLSSTHCPDLLESDFRGSKYFNNVSRFMSSIRIGSDDLYTRSLFLQPSDDPDDDEDEDVTEDEDN